MEESLNTIMWDQFGASIDMLENVIILCPDNLWDTETRFWYIAHHTLFWLDYYLSDVPAKFRPPAPFNLQEFEYERVFEPVYTKTELLTYLTHCRKKCHELIAKFDPTDLTRRFISPNRNYSTTEMLLYNMRHVQHHTAQLNLLLRQGIDDAPGWVSKAKTRL